MNWFAAAPASAACGCFEVVSLVCIKKLQSLNTEWNKVINTMRELHL